MRFSKHASIAPALIAILTVAALASISAKATTSQTLPVSCGAVGAQAYQASYTKLPLYPVVTAHGTVITVTTNSDTINGDVSSVKALMANPGPDGISLREAITATNNDPGVYTINFAPSLRGASIKIGSTQTHSLPFLTGGNVIIDGEINGDTKPDITLMNNESVTGPDDYALGIASSGNTVYGLRILNFSVGVLMASSADDAAYSGNTVSNNLMAGIGQAGVMLPEASRSFSTQQHAHSNQIWTDTVIQNSTISVKGKYSSDLSGIVIHSDQGDTFEHTRILDNVITIVLGLGDTSRGIDLFFNGKQSKAIDTMIADNTVQTGGGTTFEGDTQVVPAADGVSFDGLWITGNHLTQTGPGAGNDAIEVDSGNNVGGYSRGSSTKNVWILDNTLNGPGMQGVLLGQATGYGNSLQNVYFFGNDINFSSGPATPYTTLPLWLAAGVAGQNLTALGRNANNTILGVYIGMNTIRLTKPYPPSSPIATDILVTAGTFTAYNNTIQDLYIFNNYLDGGGASGVNIVGAWGGDDSGNTVSHVAIWCNYIPNPVVDRPGLKGINLEGGLGSGPGNVTRNTVKEVMLSDNLVVGVMNDYADIENALPGAFGNAVSGVSTSPVTSTTTVLNTITSTSTAITTATSTVTSTPPPVTTTITGPTSTATSTTTVTTGSGGVPEFPYQLIVIIIFTASLVASYLSVRHNRHLRHSSSRT